MSGGFSIFWVSCMIERKKWVIEWNTAFHVILEKDQLRLSWETADPVEMP